MKPASILRRIDKIEAKSRQRSLTSEELGEYERLQKILYLRRLRLPSQIKACQQKLARLCAEQAALS